MTTLQTMVTMMEMMAMTARAAGMMAIGTIMMMTTIKL